MKLATSPGLHGARRLGAELSDADLVRSVAEGDLAPLGVLYDRHHDGVRRFVTRAMSSSADAEDITHEAFLTLARIAGRYDGRASARPFLLGIAAQLVRRRRQGLGRWAKALASLAHTLTHRRVRTPEDTASSTEEMRRFDDALARLTDEQRLLVLLVEGEGLACEQAARALDIPVGTVWSRLHHARNQLRRALAAAPGTGGPLRARTR